MKRSDFNKIYAEYLKSDEWMAKRKQVLKRDNHTCTACLEAPATQVHHTTYERVFDEPLFHLQSVCDDCHAKIHDKRTDIERAKRFMPSGMSVTTNTRGRKQVVVQDLKIELTEEESLGDLEMTYCTNCDKWIESGGPDDWEVILKEPMWEFKTGDKVTVCEWCAEALVEDGVAEYVVDRMAL